MTMILALNLIKLYIMRNSLKIVTTPKDCIQFNISTVQQIYLS